MKTTLAKILWEKEKIHWRRIKQMFGKFNGMLNKITFGLIVATLVILGHYAFALMHTLYECFLFIVARRAFKANLQKMMLKI